LDIIFGPIADVSRCRCVLQEMDNLSVRKSYISTFICWSGTQDIQLLAQSLHPLWWPDCTVMMSQKPFSWSQE